MFCVRSLWPTSFDLRHSITYRIIEAATMGLFWGILMSSQFNGGTTELIVAEDSMTSVTKHRGLIRWTIRRTVHKGKINAFLDLKTKSGTHLGLLLSDKGEWASRLTTGFVSIPNTLPDYEDL